MTPVAETAQNGADPIFIIGTERSGSNLLRLILNAHSEIAAPHPPHFMAYFARLSKYYGDLRVDRNFLRLVDDLLAHVNGHIHPWPFLPCREALLTAPRSIFAASYALYDQYAAKAMKSRWACKSTFMIHYCDQILEYYPKAKLIWLVRDPRDVALSSTRSVFNPFHPYYTAQLWRRQQEIGLSLESKYATSTFRRMHYEDLVQRPVETLKHLCDFLEVPFEDTMIGYFSTPDALQSSALSQDWENTRYPILRENAGKFVARLSPSDISLIEYVAGPTMQALGYPLQQSPPYRTSIAVADRIGFRLRNEVLRIRAEYRSIVRDSNGWRRWRRTMRMGVLSTRLRLGLR